MSSKQSIAIRLCKIAFVALVLCSGAGSTLAAEEVQPPKDTVREEVAKPLIEAQTLNAAKKHKEALAKIDQADAVPDKTPYEAYVIVHSRGTTAYSDGNIPLAAKSFETAMTFNRLTDKEFLDIARGLAGQFYQKADYANAIVWTKRYLEKGGPDPQLKVLLVQSHYLLKDYASAAALLKEIVRNDEAAGRVTAESQLKLWVNCESILNRQAEVVAAMEKLVTHYPTKEYWNDLIYRIRRNPEFSERLLLDVYRLQMNAGTLESPEEVMDMAAMAMQAGFPSEAKKILDKGYADKLLGTGADAPKQKKLLDQAQKAATDDLRTQAQEEQRANDAKNGTVTVNTGFNFVLLGQFDKGIALIERGIAKGGLKYPDSATLKLAMAQLYAGQKDKAVQTFKTIAAKDGSADLARLWVLWASKT